MFISSFFESVPMNLQVSEESVHFKNIVSSFCIARYGVEFGLDLKLML